MKSKLLIAVLALSAVAAVVPVVSAAKESKEAKLARQAKITMAEARKTALARVPGNIESGRLEREKGKLWFEFEIHKADNNAEVEIHIDAVTGEVGEIKDEGSGSAKEAEMFRQAKVSVDEAEATALNRVSGTVVMLEFERERGKFLYEFEIITSDGKEETIHVDAVSGAVESVGGK
ncbi:hypothetical protein BH20ACI1_BH20ACI1_02140 [soil metagenome]